MKKNMTTALLVTIVLLTMNSCARYYGIKRPIAIPETKEIANQQEAVQQPPVLQEIELLQAEATVAAAGVQKNSNNVNVVLPKPKYMETFTLNQAEKHDNIHQLVPVVKVLSATAESGARMDGFAVAGFVLSLVGVFIAAYILGTLGIIFSAIGLVRINKSDGTKRGRGLAIAGLILGILGIVITTILLLIIL